MKTCPKCKSNVSDTAKFCVKCGFNIKKFEEENANKEYFCPECGTKFSGGSFCPECGYNISADISLDSTADTDSVSVASINTDLVIPSLDLSAISSMAQEQLYEKEGFVVENGILTGYIGKKRILTIPGTVEEIFDGAFEGNDLITYVEIEEGVRIIGKRAFANCGSLIKINVPASVKKIYDDTFDGVNLETLILTKSDMAMIKSCLSSVAKKYLKENELESYVSQNGDTFTVDIKAIEEIPSVKKKKTLHNVIESGSLFFGSYYQSDNQTKEPIEWLVLEKVDKKALLISKYGLDKLKLDEYDRHTWDDGCSLRRWLEGDFFKTTFDDDEKILIDTVFCLSFNEVCQYFPNKEQRICRSFKNPMEAVNWWTSDCFKETYYKAYVIDVNGDKKAHYINSTLYVRPAIWINLDL